MFLIDASKPNIEKKLHFFKPLLRGGESGEYKLKPVLFPFLLDLLAAPKFY